MKDREITNGILVENISLNQVNWRWRDTLRQFMKDKEITNVIDSYEKSFTTSGYLKRHIKALHEGQRNSKCNSSGKSFTQSGNLKNHIKTMHEGQRNYKCDSCEKSYAKLGSLKYHIKTIHEEQRCGK